MMRPTNFVILSFLFVFCSGVPKAEATISKDVNDLKFFYIPSPGQKIEIVHNNVISLDASNLRAGVKTVVIVDGFLSDSTTPTSVECSARYSSRGDTNVIVVDWGKLSGSGSTFANQAEVLISYISVKGNVGPIGQRVAEFLNFLRENKQIEFSDVTILGHSMGAHIAGIAGATVRNNYNSLVGRIIGLDPAGPLFSLIELSPDKRISKGQASFVDIYHTNRGTLGDSTDTGDVDIYVNGGKSQPGCKEADSSGFPGYCSHAYSVKFFNSLFDDNVIACPCKVVLLLFDECTCATCRYQCDNGINVGPNIDTSGSGRYHVSYGPIA